MSSVSAGALAGVEPRIWTVAEFNRHVARLLEQQVPLVWITGELSNVTRAASGHWYFSLKDRDAQVRCVMFRNANRLVDFSPKEGDAIEARALAGLYAPRGEFQLTVESMRRAGAGALYEAFLRIKGKLAGEGLFDAQRKLPLPAFPRAVGIVTSLKAAALGDVLTTLSRRAPHLRVVIYPSLVQGREAPAQLVAAIQRALKRAHELGEIDVLMVVRGGGSIEDLWAFNDEAVARAIADARIPVVSGVGHETDVTIADFVADVRGATPTAAAELVSPDASRLKAMLNQHALRLSKGARRAVVDLEQRLDDARRRLKSPLERMAMKEQGLVHLVRALAQNMAASLALHEHRLERARSALYQKRPDVERAQSQAAYLGHRLRESAYKALGQGEGRLALAAAKLRLLDPDFALERGYAIVADALGHVVATSDRLAAGDDISIRFARGAAKASIVSVDAKGNAPA